MIGRAHQGTFHLWQRPAVMAATMAAKNVNSRRICPRGWREAALSPSLNSAVGCFLCVGIDVLLVGSSGSTSRSKQVLYNWLPDPYLRAIMLEFCKRQRQPAPSVRVPDDGLEGCLVEPRTL